MYTICRNTKNNFANVYSDCGGLFGNYYHVVDDICIGVKDYYGTREFLHVNCVLNTKNTCNHRNCEFREINKCFNAKSMLIVSYLHMDVIDKIKVTFIMNQPFVDLGLFSPLKLAILGNYPKSRATKYNKYKFQQSDFNTRRYFWLKCECGKEFDDSDVVYDISSDFDKRAFSEVLSEIRN